MVVLLVKPYVGDKAVAHPGLTGAELALQILHHIVGHKALSKEEQESLLSMARDK